MKFLSKLLLTAGLTFFLGMNWLFYIVMAAVILLNILVKTRSFQSFLSGFLGVGLVWWIYAWLLAGSDGVLIHGKIAELLGISGAVLLLAIFLLGAVTGGLSALTGSLFRRLFERTKKNYNPYH